MQKSFTGNPDNFTAFRFTAFRPNVQINTILLAALTMTAIFTLLATIGVLVAAVYILSLSFTAIGEMSLHIATVYNHSDSFTQLLMIGGGGYLLARIAPHVARPVARRFTLRQV